MFTLLQVAYYAHIASILMTCGAILATIGACRIYYKWMAGHTNMENEIVQWAGGILLLLVSSLIASSLFGQ